MTDLDKNNLINKFLAIEQWAFRARHLVETMNQGKLIFACKRIRHDLEDLEVILKVEN
jgi:hypothetical protein